MLIRSRNRDRSRGGSVALSSLATGYLNGVTPYHYLDFIANRALYAGADVGTVAGGTGYSFTRASDGYYTNSDGTLTLFGSGALRRGDRGVLIEGARTNLISRSQEFDNASWTATRATVTANAAVAPDGTTTADKLVEDATPAASHQTGQAVTTAATAHTLSVFLKAGERTWARLIAVDGGAYFNLTTGAVGTVAAGTVSLSALTPVALGNGWYRCSVVFTPTAASQTMLVRPATSDNNQVYDGDGTSGIFIWGAQLEAASFASSYIPTVAAAATRAADVLTYTAGVSYGLSLWAEFERAVDTGVTQNILRVDDGDASDRANFYIGSSDDFRAGMVTANVSQGDVGVAGAVVVDTVYKGAARYATNSIQACRSGTLATEDTSATAPATPTRIIIGADSVASGQLFGYIRRVAVVSSAVSDANLQVMTS